MNINFNVYGQKLICRNSGETSVVVEGSENFLTCVFEFCEEWDGLYRAALFLAEGETVPVVAVIDSEGKCKVPDIIAYKGGTCQIAVVGGSSEDFIESTDSEGVSGNIVITTSIYTLCFDKTIRFTETAADETTPNPLVEILSKLDAVQSKLDGMQTKDFIITSTSHIFDNTIVLYDIGVPYIEVKKAFEEGKNVWLCITELSMRETNTRIKLPLVAVSDEMALFSIVDHEGAPITFFCRASDNYWIGQRTPHLPKKNFDEYLESMWDFDIRIRAIEAKLGM